MAVSRISKEDLKARLDKEPGARPVLVDARLRYPFVHSSMQLPGAVRMSPDQVTADGLPKDRDIVVYDSDPDEITAVRVAAALLATGRRVEVLKGGLPEWVGANLPVDAKDAVRTPAPPPKE
jgi:3-mercaptopyruvate sulfurtransferase SseA